jgi:hypothetical protein
MKLFPFAVILAVVSFQTHASDVGVSVSIGQPNFYGQIDIGGYPPPQVIYRQPRVSYDRPPLYLRVPPGHARNWDKHCGTYNACNQQVYFVKDNWYNNQYAPRYQERNSGYRDGHGDDRNGRHDEGRNHDNNR